MGIEVWAFTALIVILAVYLLPFLVRRREMTGRANVQDRYSAELRVLATGVAAPERDGTCESSGHAELFRRRPKVRAMNRPAVRNVRALRAERELIHVRKTHARARERRRVAAAHRAVVASILLGVALGAWVLGLFTALPWWPALVPTVLLGASMTAGRRAAMASAAADKRERRRIAELERELMGLTGRRPAVPVVASSRADGAAGATEGTGAQSASGAEPAGGADGAVASSVRAGLPEILQELRAENAERERARAAARAEAAPAAEAVGQEAARSAHREDRDQVAEQRDAERREAEREEHRRRRSEEERRERAEAAARAGSARSPQPVDSAESALSPGSAGGGDSEFRSAAGSFDAFSPDWSQIVPDSQQDEAGEGAPAIERSAPRHSTASGSAASRLTASSVATGSSASRSVSAASAAERRREGSSAEGSARQASPAASGEGRWSLSAESAESVSARAATGTRTEGAAAQPSDGARPGERAAEEAGRSASGAGAGGGAARRSIKKEALAAFPDKSVVKEPATATPPQGWRPIKVPAPTYTLAARAPKRVFADPVVDEGASAPVPARPQAVRTFTAPDFTEQDFHPIDLDAILERRRAAGE